MQIVLAWAFGMGYPEELGRPGDLGGYLQLGCGDLEDFPDSSEEETCLDKKGKQPMNKVVQKPRKPTTNYKPRPMIGPDEARQHNHSNAPFYNTPPELILMVSDILAPLERMRLVQVCKKFRQTLVLRGVPAEPKYYLHSKEDWFHHDLLLHHDEEIKQADDYQAKCDLARPLSLLYCLGCSGCRRIHPAEDFTAEQLDRPPHRRLCRGLETELRLCDGHTTSGALLLAALRQTPVMEVWSPRGYAEEAHGADLLRSVDHCVLRRGRGATLNRAIPLMPPEAPGPADWTPAALCRLDEPLCAHLRTGDAGLLPDYGSPPRPCADPPTTYLRLGVINWSDYNACDLAPLWCDVRSDEAAEKGRARRCPAVGCRTFYGLYELWDNAVLVVSRDVVGGDPAHPSWLGPSVPRARGGGGRAGAGSRRSGCFGGVTMSAVRITSRRLSAGR
jgi:hypothetical protein